MKTPTANEGLCVSNLLRKLLPLWYGSFANWDADANEEMCVFFPYLTYHFRANGNFTLRQAKLHSP